MLMMASVVVSAFALTPVSHEAYSSDEIQTHVGVLPMSDQDDKNEKIIPHYDSWGNWTGRTHGIDIWLYDEIVDAILDKGGLPTPRNVDRVYHEMENGR
jgi:hypothetical protein